MQYLRCYWVVWLHGLLYPGFFHFRLPSSSFRSLCSSICFLKLALHLPSPTSVGCVCWLVIYAHTCSFYTNVLQGTRLYKITFVRYETDQLTAKLYLLEFVCQSPGLDYYENTLFSSLAYRTFFKRKIVKHLSTRPCRVHSRPIDRSLSRLVHAGN